MGTAGGERTLTAADDTVFAIITLARGGVLGVKFQINLLPDPDERLLLDNFAIWLRWR